MLAALRLTHSSGVLPKPRGDNPAMPASSIQEPALPPFNQPRPANLRDLFWSFTWLALQGFGGVLAVVQRELVEKKQWLTREEFLEDWAVAQVLPGPNVVNLGLMMGDRYFGLRGALVALAGLLLFPVLIVLMLAAVFSSVAHLPAAQGALRGMGTVAAGLIAATGIRLIPALKKNVMGLSANVLLGTATFVAIALFRIPLAWVLLVVGSLACAMAWRRLGAISR